jgi:hypothetical protein
MSEPHSLQPPAPPGDRYCDRYVPRTVYCVLRTAYCVPRTEPARNVYLPVMLNVNSFLPV